MVVIIVSVIAIIAIVVFCIVFDGRKKRPRKAGGLSGEPTIKVDSNEEPDHADDDGWQPNWFDMGEDGLGRAEFAALERKKQNSITS